MLKTSSSRGIDLYRYETWTPEVADSDLDEALYDLFQTVAADLGVEEMTDPGFTGYAADVMAGCSVPLQIRQAALARLRP